MPRATSMVLLIALTTALVTSAAARPSSVPGVHRRPPVLGKRSIDASQRIDVNQVSMVVTNFGAIAFDTQDGAAGLEYPKGSGKTAVFAAGPWLGASV